MPQIVTPAEITAKAQAPKAIRPRNVLYRIYLEAYIEQGGMRPLDNVPIRVLYIIALAQADGQTGMLRSKGAFYQTLIDEAAPLADPDVVLQLHPTVAADLKAKIQIVNALLSFCTDMSRNEAMAHICIAGQGCQLKHTTCAMGLNTPTPIWKGPKSLATKYKRKMAKLKVRCTIVKPK